MLLLCFGFSPITLVKKNFIVVKPQSFLESLGLEVLLAQACFSAIANSANYNRSFLAFIDFYSGIYQTPFVMEGLQRIKYVAPKSYSTSIRARNMKTETVMPCFY